MKTKLRRQLSISLKEDENSILEILELKGITHVAVFRAGLKHYQENSVDDLTQNNVS